MNIQLKSCNGEVINCSVKEVVTHESGRISYYMDNKKCNDFHSSQFDDESCDSRIRRIDVFISGNYHVFASYKNSNGSYRQGMQAIDAAIITIK